MINYLNKQFLKRIDRLPTGGIYSALGAWNSVRDFEKIRSGEAEMRQRTSRVGESYYPYVHIYRPTTNSSRPISAIEYFVCCRPSRKRELCRVTTTLSDGVVLCITH